MFFNANFPANYLGATVSGPLVTVNEDAGTIQLTASATIPTSFMSLFGFNDITVAVNTEITRVQKALDVVLAIDMSGSMGSLSPGGGTRLSAARGAAKDLVDILYGSSGSKDHLNIGLVPWNGKVNVTLNGSTFEPAGTVTTNVSTFINPESGSTQSEVYFSNNSPVPLLSLPYNDWQGCVYSRYSHDADDSNDADRSLPPVTIGGADWHAWQPIGPEGEPVSGGTCSLAVNGNEPDWTLAWGREMLHNYRPDHISTPDYRWRYVAAVRTDIKYGSQDNKYDKDKS